MKIKMLILQLLFSVGVIFGLAFLVALGGNQGSILNGIDFKGPPAGNVSLKTNILTGTNRKTGPVSVNANVSDGPVSGYQEFLHKISRPESQQSF